MSTDRLKYVLFAIFLILTGLGLVGVGLGGGAWDLITGICAVIAGILFIVYRDYYHRHYRRY